MTFLKLKDTVVTEAPLGFARDYIAEITAYEHLLAWWEGGDEYFTVYEDGAVDRATTWTSRFGSMAFTQATNTAKPEIVPAALNGKPVARFATARDDRMGLTGGSFPVNTETTTKIVVFKPLASFLGPTQNLLGNGPSGGQVDGNLFYLLSSSHVLASTISFTSADAPSASTANAVVGDEWHVGQTVFDPITQQVRVKLNTGAIAEDTGTSATPSNTELWLASRTSSAIGLYKGDIAAILLTTNDALADSAFQEILRGYLASRFGLSGIL